MKSGLVSVSGKKARTRTAVNPAVTESGIWLSATRPRREYSWKGRLKSSIRPDVSFHVCLLIRAGPEGLGG